MAENAHRPRLFLVAPPCPDEARFPAQLAEALAAAEVAAVLLSLSAGPKTDGIAAMLVPIIQAAGAAALIANDTRIAGRLKADGVQIDTGPEDMRAVVESWKPKRIVGAGNIHSRHAAMEVGDLGVDYVFFGRPHGDTHAAPHPKSLELAEWWSDLMAIPAVVMAGHSPDSVASAGATGADFVAVHDVVWSHPQGPGEAMRQVAAMLNALGREAA